ncbi:MAG TPA: transcription termination/antitermination NusG family protein [Tepidisphaeraceae bacterium]|jgi:transcription antitermination factor NusG|nr:transcription termination/antitermination NusG family protein [Tepidisphaeraceae bacterium]
MSLAAPTSSPDLVWSPLDGRTGHEWYLLRVRSNQEKPLADTLAAMGVGHFLPLVRRARYWGRRKAVVEEPLFAGYVFLRGAVDDVYRADRTRRVASIVRVSDQRRLDWELRNIRLALAGDAALLPTTCLKNGTRVEVRSGPFRGLQGLISERVKENRLVLQVRILGAATSLEIDAGLLDPLD